MSVLGLSTPDAGPVIVGAGFWIRALARFVDGLYSLAVGFVAGVLAGITVAILEGPLNAAPGAGNRLSQEGPAALIVALIGTVLYEAFFEGVCGATPGKLVCRLHVLSQDLTPCGLKPAFIRSFAYLVDALFFGMIGYMSMRDNILQQRYGDRWGKTVVVSTSHVPKVAERSGLRFVLAFALGSAALGLPLVAVIVWNGLGE